MEIYLAKKVIENKNLSDEAIAVYVALRSIHKKDLDYYYLNNKALYYYLYGDFSYTQHLLKKVSDGLQELINSDLVKLVAKDKLNYVLDLSSIYIDSRKKGEYFVIVTSDEVNKIYSCNSITYFKLLRYFIYLVSTFIKREGAYVGFMPIRILGGSVNINKDTTAKYNNILEELRLIYICRSDDIIKYDDGTIAGMSNTYGRYKDKDKVIAANLDHRKEYGFGQKQLNRLDGNKTRSASQKYNHLLAGKEYPYDETKEIYLRLVEYNKKQEKFNSEKVKDLNMFSGYDFYIGEFGELESKLIKAEVEVWGSENEITKNDVVNEPNGNCKPFNGFYDEIKDNKFKEQESVQNEDNENPREPRDELITKVMNEDKVEPLAVFYKDTSQKPKYPFEWYDDEDDDLLDVSDMY